MPSGRPRPGTPRCRCLSGRCTTAATVSPGTTARAKLGYLELHVIDHQFGKSAISIRDIMPVIQTLRG